MTNEQLHFNERLVSLLESQDRLNDALSKALESIRLSAEHYESRLEKAEARIESLERHVGDLEVAHGDLVARLARTDRLHSVRA